MGNLILERVLQKLKDAGFSAGAAYPGKTFSRITGPVATAHIKEVDDTGMVVTVEVILVSPETFGGTACEIEALRAAEALRELGAVCSQRGCVYDSRGQVFSVSILAEFKYAVSEEDEGLLPRFRILLDGALVQYAVAFTAEMKTDRKAVCSMGSREVEAFAAGPKYWQLTLEEALPSGIPEDEPKPEQFWLLAYSMGGEQRFTGCCWTSERYEYTSPGLRRIRTGVALNMEEKHG